MAPQPRQLTISEHDYGWTVVYTDESGHVRHLVSEDSELRAFRSARKVAHIYNLHGKVRVETARGTLYYDIDKL